MTLPLAARAADDGAPSFANAAVSRLSVVDGTVTIARGDANARVAAVVNAPVLASDYVTTGAQSRAEVQFDGKTVVRLGQNVQMRFSHVDPDNRQLQVAAGTIEYRLLAGTDGRTTIDTPSISVVPRATGTYRVMVDNDGATYVTVRDGHADIETPQGAQPLDPGSTLVAKGTASHPQLATRAAIAYDSFDAFNADRDREEQRTLADSPYVSNDIGGVSDLGAYGQWAPDGSYGEVWLPNGVAAGWAPYRNGSWVLEPGFGWTWVAAEPWGWAPYHYGRWYYSTAYNRWAWYPPGRSVVAPAWSPALVGFIGLSFGAVNVGLGFGNVGWVPLAPHEAVRRADFDVSVNIVHVYRNAQFYGVSRLSEENARAGRFGGAVAVSPQQLAQRAPSFAAERAPSYAERAPSYAAERAPTYARSYGYALPSYGYRAAYAPPAYSRPSYQQRSAPARQAAAVRGRAEGRYQR